MGIYDYEATIDNDEIVPLSQYKDKVLLIVNTASKCGFTPQYDELEELYKKYGNEKFEILAFPCNQFKNQEPAKNDEIRKFCLLNFGVSFPVFDKVDVKGANAHPLFKYLVKEKKGLFGGAIKWNFTKFLINSKGEVVERYAPATNPMKMEEKIKELIEEIK